MNPFKDWKMSDVEQFNARQRNTGQENTLAGGPTTPPASGPRPAMARLEVRPRPELAGMCKTSQAWMRRLQSRSYPWIGVQSVTFSLGRHGRVTPSFMAIGSNGQPIFWDTKPRHLLAAHFIPWAEFYQVKRLEQEIMAEEPVVRSPEPMPLLDSGLNRTESAWLSHLKTRNYGWLASQSVTLKIGYDCRYSPDFAAIGPNSELLFWEVKGFMRDDARVKLLVAARQFPFARFFLVRKAKGSFTEEPVKP